MKYCRLGMFLNKKINYIYIYSRKEIFLMLKLKKNNVVGIFKKGMNDSIADQKKNIKIMTDFF